MVQLKVKSETDRVLFCCCDKSNCNEKFSWTGNLKKDDKENSIMEKVQEMNNEDMIIGILLGVSVLCGIVIITLLLIIVIHSIKSRSVSSIHDHVVVKWPFIISFWCPLNCQVNILISRMWHKQSKQMSMFCNYVHKNFCTVHITLKLLKDYIL